MTKNKPTLFDSALRPPLAGWHHLFCAFQNLLQEKKKQNLIQGDVKLWFCDIQAQRQAVLIGKSDYTDRL